MGENWRIFKLLMHKNMIVRKRHWRMVLFVEVMIPVLLFLLGQVTRVLSGSGPVRIEEYTYHDPEYLDDIPISQMDSFILRYAPMNKITNHLMEETRRCMEYLKPAVGSPSEEHMLAEFERTQSPMMSGLGIVFQNIDDSVLPKDFKYKVYTGNWLPDNLYEKEENGFGSSTAFGRTPFIRMQKCLDTAYIKNKTSLFYERKFSIQQMPYPPYIYVDSATIAAGEAFAELAKLAFLIVLCIEVTFPSNEKYIGINILMSVNGVKNYQNLFSWLINGIIFSIVYLAPIVIMLKYVLPPTIIPYLLYGNSFIIWIVFTIHVCHVIAFGIHITAYLWKPSHGVFAAFMIITVLDIVNKYTTGRAIRHFLIYMGILAPNFLLSRIFGEINSYETQLIGVQWSNIFSHGDVMTPPENCIGVMTIFSLLGIVIHFTLAIYVYEIRPGKYGVAQNPLFFLKRGNKIFHDFDASRIECNGDEQKEFEKVPAGTLTPGIQIRDLKKSYITHWFRGTAVQALKGINVDFYKGQITVLLGHNGAGKTTMMSILSGLTSSTEGMVFVNGKNVQYELDSVRKDLGLCPQENMVFPDLTVHQQVLFFGMLKAKDKTVRQLEEEVNVLLSKVNLSDKKNSIAKELSGGQKRRMCLAMAVIGDASVIILDEPTSGMDAESKREVWDIILKLRGETTILISTHDMEEADILGDRIAIIHSGKMRSYGTSMFLKKLYGDGQVEVTLSIEPTCDPQKIIDEIGLHAQLLSRDEGQAVLAIPFADNLPDALDKLEKQKKALGVTGLSVSIITLEQVFLRVTREEGDQTDSASQAAKSFIKTSGFNYFVQTTSAYILKKFAFTRKNPWTFFLSMILPCLSAILMLLQHGNASTSPISLTLDTYSGSKSFSSSLNPSYGKMYTQSAEGFGGTSEDIGAKNLSDALLNVAIKDLSSYRNKYIVSGEFIDINEVKGFYSGSAYYSIPITINMLTNTLVKTLTGDKDFTITLSAQRLPQSSSSFNGNNTADSFLLTMFLLVFLAPAVALYVTQPLQENLSNVKQLQAMTGASTISYWLAIYLSDLVQYTISIILLLSTFIITDVCFGTQYYHGIEIMIFFLLLFIFGASVLPLVYVFSFWKKSMNASVNLLSITPLIISFIDFLMFGLVDAVDHKLFDIFREVQSRIFLLFPYMSFIYGHLSFFTVVLQNARCRSMPTRMYEATCSVQPQLDQCCTLHCEGGSCEDHIPYFTKNPLWTSLGDSLIWMTGSTILFFSIIFILEQKLLANLLARLHRGAFNGNNNTMDELVKKEADVVASEILRIMKKHPNVGPAGSENIFLVHELTKRYGNLHVVKGISFRVKQGECFGLLGVNGAGKSTTFRMLTGEEIPRSGSMYLKQCSLTTNRREYLGEMGYCPQQDAIIDTLNAWDHLYLFARLRGIPKNEVKATVEKWIYKLNLQKCAAQPSGTYSGGNKRRLNIAMALIGNPSLVLMDEPTTGVDPAARRSLWNTLKTCQEGGQSIILTSHSMEECEALCNRLVIMIKGQLVCIGASQELKQRFGAGYNIHVKLNPANDRSDVDNIKRRIEMRLTAKLIDQNTGFIGYHVTDPEATWTIMYTLMNELKNDYPCIEDFAVLSSTLEQLFIQFARAPGQEQTVEADKRKRRRCWQKRGQASPV